MVVSQLGYPPIPEGLPRGHGGTGRWIPATTNLYMVAHPVWWLEDHVRLRRRGEHDDAYTGRVAWELVGRGLMDPEDGMVSDTLAFELGIDLEEPAAQDRVRDWLVGREDPALSQLVLFRPKKMGRRWARQRAARVRGRLEQQLAIAVNLLEAADGSDDDGVADAIARFTAVVPTAVYQPLVNAVEAGDQHAMRGAIGEVAFSLEVAWQLVGVLYRSDRHMGPGPLEAGWEAPVFNRFAVWSQQPGPASAAALVDEVAGQVDRVVAVGRDAVNRLMWLRRSAGVDRGTPSELYGPDLGGG